MLRIKLNESNNQYRAEMAADLVSGNEADGTFVRKSAFAVISVTASSYEEAEQKAFRLFEARSAKEGFDHCSIWSSWVVDATSSHHSPHYKEHADYRWEL